MKKGQNLMGLIVIILTLIMGKTMLGSSMLFFRLLAGIGFGYALTRGFMGFAGSVNRAYNTGSAKLMKVLAWMFLGSAAVSVAFLYNADASSYDLWVNQVNLGLILGGILFGFGMTFSACCASGVLTDLVTGLPRAIITLLFFGMGIFLGFPFQRAATWVQEAGIPTDWIRKSLVTSETGAKLYGGVYFPDLFKWDGLNGYLGATILTAVLAGIVVYIAKKYEDSHRAAGTFTGVASEMEQYKECSVDANKPFKLFSEETYELMFVRPWTMKTGAMVITAIFTLLMGVTKAGWGASTPYGWWFGKLLMVFGVSPEALAKFTNFPEKLYTMPFFNHPINVQNFGIIVGTIICLLLAGTFHGTVRSELKITFKEAILFAMGGLLMGFGTRLSNGCNVGALYTPIANFSLSGWVFFAALVAGGIFGNRFAKKVK
jgi:uncharacterized membrane protein YedE/YeeE